MTACDRDPFAFSGQPNLLHSPRTRLRRARSRQRKHQLDSLPPMLLAPQRQQEARKTVPRIVHAMHPDVAAAAQSSQSSQNVHAWPAVMHDEPFRFPAVQAAAIARYGLRTEPGEAEPFGIAAVAAAARVDFPRAAAAPERRLLDHKTNVRKNREWGK